MNSDRRAILAVAMGSLATRGLARPASESLGDWIPIAVDAKHVHVRVELNGEPFIAVVDSGAAQSVIDVRLARRLGLRTHDGLTAQGVAATARAGIAGRLDLRLGAVTWTLARVAVVDLAAVRQTGDAVFVILGRDLFEQGVVRFDFTRDRMRIDTRPDFIGAAGSLVPLLPTSHALRRTVVAVEAQPRCAAEFDLGNGSAMLMSRDYADAHRLLAGKRTSSWISVGVEGVTRYDTATLETVRLGSTTFEQVPVDVYDAWSTPDVPINIGLPLLRRFDLATDYAHDRLWLGPGPRTRQPFARDRSGLACRWDEDALQVVHVARGSPASRDAWRSGDRITRVDGVAASPSTLAWGQGEVGRIYLLTLSDATTRRLTLENYY